MISSGIEQELLCPLALLPREQAPWTRRKFLVAAGAAGLTAEIPESYNAGMRYRVLGSRIP